MICNVAIPDTTPNLDMQVHLCIKELLVNMACAACEVTGIVLQGRPGDFVAVDSGFAGCRPLPTRVQITSPIAFKKMPTDMTSDASGSALQPVSTSDAWVNLVTVRDFKPVFLGGVIVKDFAIPPLRQPSDSPARAIGAIPDVLIQIGMPSDVVLDITGLFTNTGRVCCPIITLSIVNFEGSTDADGLSATAGQGATVSPDIPSGFTLPSSFSSMTLSSPSSAVIPFAPLIQPSGSSGFYGYESHGIYGPVSASPSPSPPISFSEPAGPAGPSLNLTSQIPVPTWLSTQFEFKSLAPGSQQLTTWQYIRLSHTVPVTAVGQYVIGVLARNTGSNLTSAVLFNLDVVDFYQVRVSLALGGIPPTGLSPFQQAAFQTGISAAFNLSTSQVSLDTPSGQRRMLLQSSGYVLSFSITGLNGRRKALALAKSVEQSVKNGQLSRSLRSSGQAILGPPSLIQSRFWLRDALCRVMHRTHDALHLQKAHTGVNVPHLADKHVSMDTWRYRAPSSSNA